MKYWKKFISHLPNFTQPAYNG